MNALQIAIQTLLDKPDIQKLKDSSASITTRYREGLSLHEDTELLTYLIVRLPATYAALRAVLSKLPSPGSILDIGSGPATVWWAAQQLWSDNFTMTALEREAKFIELGRQLGANVDWIKADIQATNELKPHDWVTFGYSMGELSKPLAALEKAWDVAQKGIVIVEPGTPKGYKRILECRDFLIQKGGFVLAPCPHSNRCPLQDTSSWCHFAVRLERTSLHRQLKGGTLGYEDEKYSYVIVTKESYPALSRIIDHPVLHSGHVSLSLCGPNGLEKTTITRSNKPLYKKARKADWGDSWP